jgi:hypothetical protein
LIRLLSIFFILFQTLPAVCQYDELRALFFSASTSEGKTKFLDATKNLDLSKAEHLAYRGVATAMSAELAESVSDKLRLFNTGKDLLEQAVLADWYNAEIRFLRFSMQAEVPFFLGYNDKKEEDAKVILDALYQSKIAYKTDFWKKALRYMVDSDELSGDTESALEKYKT